jgi:hypothetical protein
MGTHLVLAVSNTVRTNPLFLPMSLEHVDPIVGLFGSLFEELALQPV